MSTNNFKMMDDEMKDKYPKAPAEIEHNVESNIHSYSFFGKVVELFIPRIFDSLINMVGGGSKKNLSNPPTIKKNIDPSSRGNAKSDEASDRGDII